MDGVREEATQPPRSVQAPPKHHRSTSTYTTGQNVRDTRSRVCVQREREGERERFTATINYPTSKESNHSHCVGADGSGRVEVPLREEQILRYPLPGLVHVAHAEQCLRRASKQ